MQLPHSRCRSRQFPLLIQSCSQSRLETWQSRQVNANRIELNGTNSEKTRDGVCRNAYRNGTYRRARRPPGRLPTCICTCLAADASSRARSRRRVSARTRTGSWSARRRRERGRWAFARCSLIPVRIRRRSVCGSDGARWRILIYERFQNFRKYLRCISKFG